MPCPSPDNGTSDRPASPVTISAGAATLRPYNHGHSGEYARSMVAPACCALHPRLGNLSPGLGGSKHYAASMLPGSLSAGAQGANVPDQTMPDAGVTCS